MLNDDFGVAIPELGGASKRPYLLLFTSWGLLPLDIASDSLAVV